MDLRETYNKIAEDWHKDHLRDDWWVVGTEAFVLALPAGAHILDAGCGSGLKAKYFLERGFKVTGIDFSEKMIEVARREYPEAKFEVMDITKPLTFTDLFDGVCLQAVLLHIPRVDALKVLATVASVLKPGGLLYVAVKEKKLNRDEEEVAIENDYGYEYSRFFSYYTREEILEMLKELSFEIVFQTIAHSGKANWVQAIGKKS